MESRIVFGPESAIGSFAPGSRAEARLRAAEAGAKGINNFADKKLRGGLESRNQLQNPAHVLSVWLSAGSMSDFRIHWRKQHRIAPGRAPVLIMI